MVSGLTAGITNAAFGTGQSADSLVGLSNQSGTLQPVAGAAHPGWVDQLLGIGARSLISAGIQSAINGSSFDAALRDALVGDLAALGANRIGSANLDTVPHAVSHAALGAIAAGLTGRDPAAGAIGALTSALAAQPIDEALDLTGTSRQAAVTALAMLSGGIVSDALGYDPVTGANAALNEVQNNYLSDKRPNLAAKSEQERFRSASAACFRGNQAACAVARELTSLSSLRDDNITVACGDRSSSRCRAMIREAIDAGNTVHFARNGAAIVYPEDMPALTESGRASNTFQDSVAQGIADLLVVEGLSAGANAILRGLGYVGTRLFSYESAGIFGESAAIWTTNVLQQGESTFARAGNVSTSPWLSDSRAGVRVAIEEFRDGGSFLVPRSTYDYWIAGKEIVGRADGQFMTSRSAMDGLLTEAGGDMSIVKKRLGIPQNQWNEPIVRIDVMNPLLHNARLPSGLSSGANSQFQWGGFTSGGMPELITNPIPRTDIRATQIP